MKPTHHQLRYTELIMACLLATAGMCLLFVAFYAPPQGEIHTSVLVAYGEVMTFAGGLMGIDYHYRRNA
ncbi:hypothetical protein [Porphyromonas pogonae]|uniref:hypothetical protein n=1 Tax=Porphyromonas pogonae TaxID=867595 RepID=UPI002E78F73D|nr:hypothetical protein [Porphyromonas pogonae]